LTLSFHSRILSTVHIHLDYLVTCSYTSEYPTVHHGFLGSGVLVL
jgi:hypothetical protein